MIHSQSDGRFRSMFMSAISSYSVPGEVRQHSFRFQQRLFTPLDVYAATIEFCNIRICRHRLIRCEYAWTPGSSARLQLPRYRKRESGGALHCTDAICFIEIVEQVV